MLESIGEFVDLVLRVVYVLGAGYIGYLTILALHKYIGA